MKFKINKQQVDFLSSKFKKEDFGFQEIELELVNDTVSEAIIRKNLEDTAWHKGYHYGFKEGFYEGRKREFPFCKCGCGGNNCFLRHCDEFCRLYNR